MSTIPLTTLLSACRLSLCLTAKRFSKSLDMEIRMLRIFLRPLTDNHYEEGTPAWLPVELVKPKPDEGDPHG